MTFDEFLSTNYAEAITERSAIIQYACNISRIEAEIEAAKQYTIRYGFLARRSLKPENKRDESFDVCQNILFEE